MGSDKVSGKWFWWGLVLMIIVAILLIMAVVRWFSYQILFHPRKDHIWSPESEYDSFFIDIESRQVSLDEQPNSIHCWHFRQYEERPTVIFYHGNSGNISHRSYMVYICDCFHLNLLLVDYRGFGFADGIPSPEGVYQDGLVAYDYLNRDKGIPDNQIIIWGESLGGAVGAKVASEHPNIRILILMSTFSSLPDALIYRGNRIDQSNKMETDLIGNSSPKQTDNNGKNEISGFFYYFMSVLSKLITIFFHDMPSKKLIEKVNAPILIFHSESDLFIPYKCAEILESSNPRCKLVTIGGDHPSPDIKPEQVCKLFEMAQVSVTYDREHLEQILDLMRRFFTELKSKNYIA